MRTPSDQEIMKNGFECPVCGDRLMPVMFMEEEEIYDSYGHYKTGRVRRSCSHLECVGCFHKEAVDDTFLAGDWFKPSRRPM